ncbi:unnamed protein product [Thlaspi arvense]|uniref:Uncharacterized protein n=1 Tax=Thlaspi arvense TaxID=13288 RepID=A0AAU9S704_THLAR|nr:unnamed protein product [Thlaspi arvense]
MGLPAVGIGARELRRRTVRRFFENFRSVSREGRQAIDSAITHMYSPGLKSGWVVDVVQEVKIVGEEGRSEGFGFGH